MKHRTTTSQGYYDSIATSYDELHGSEQRNKMRIVREILTSDTTLDLGMGRDVFLLDVGCGTGISTNAFPAICAGIDPARELLSQGNSIRMLENTQSDPSSLPVERHGSNAGYIQGLAEAIPVKDKSCAISVSITAVHNFNDVKSGIAELCRITSERSIITVLKKSSRFDEIIVLIKDRFEVLHTEENDFDIIFYLKPKS